MSLEQIYLHYCSPEQTNKVISALPLTTPSNRWSCRLTRYYIKVYVTPQHSPLCTNHFKLTFKPNHNNPMKLTFTLTVELSSLHTFEVQQRIGESHGGADIQWHWRLFSGRGPLRNSMHVSSSELRGYSPSLSLVSEFEVAGLSMCCFRRDSTELSMCFFGSFTRTLLLIL